MKRLIVSLILVLLATSAYSAERRVSWEAPTTYEDGTPIPSEISSKIVYKLYANNVNFATVIGEAFWVGNLPQQPGESKIYTCTASTENSEESKHSPPLVYILILRFDSPTVMKIEKLNPGE